VAHGHDALNSRRVQPSRAAGANFATAYTSLSAQATVAEPGAAITNNRVRHDYHHDKMLTDYVFEAVGIEKKFDDGQVQALRGVTFRVRPGEFLAITGPSGSGKTTLLQMLGALDRPTAGRLLYRGKSIPDLPDPWTYRAREIGFIFQAFHLLPTFTALENVQIPMFETNLPRSERKPRAAALLKSVGLEHRLNHFPAQFGARDARHERRPAGVANHPDEGWAHRVRPGSSPRRRRSMI
jgi:ABC-type transport system involved in cytochrome bd biosynthesis fused ATPase/permease subunit